MSDRPCNRWLHLYVPHEWAPKKVAASVRQWEQRRRIEECQCGFYRLIDYRAVPIET